MKEKVTCLHCWEENISSEHRCIYELIDTLSIEISQIKEDNCENSGKNWYDSFESFKNEVLAFNKTKTP